MPLPITKKAKKGEMMKRVFSFITVFLSLVIFSGCYHPVKVYLEKPPRVNVGTGKIAVARITGTGGDDLEDKITNKLDESGYYQLVDKTYLEKILAEQNLTWSDLSVVANVVKVGKKIGALALITGDVIYSEYDEEPVKYKKVVDKNGAKHQIGTRVGRAKFKANIRIVNAKTGNVIYSNRFPVDKKLIVDAEDAPPPQIDGFELLGDCRGEVADKFVDAITPIRAEVNLDYELNDDIPLLEKGYNMVKVKNYNKAIEYFKEATDKKGNYWQTWWDLGLTYEAAGMHKKADEALSKAYDIHPKGFIAEEIAQNKTFMWHSGSK